LWSVHTEPDLWIDFRLYHHKLCSVSESSPFFDPGPFFHEKLQTATPQGVDADDSVKSHQSGRIAEDFFPLNVPPPAVDIPAMVERHHDI
jgi:hypothetical protein